MNATARPLRIAVCGAGRANTDVYADAEAVGRAIAEAGAVLICGGLGGVMEAAARGAAEAGGLTIGFLPGAEPSDANPHIAIPLATGMGEARNVLIARAADAVIAVGGGWGTLSEVALAMKMGVPVVLLRPGRTSGLGLPEAEDPADAVERAIVVGSRRAAK